MRLTKDVLNGLSGFAGFVVVIVFGFWLLTKSSTQNLNIASWVMWALMDLVVVLLCFKAGNKRPYLFIGWMLATLIVVGIMLAHGASWSPSPIESEVNWVTVAAVMICVYFLVTDKSEDAMKSKKCLYLCAVAMFIAGVPQLITYWSSPSKDTWWLWVATALICLATIFTTEKKLSVFNAPTFSSLTYQVVILAIMYR